MVLCQYYLNNNCRFGSKCVNEHFDVKQLIKAEIEAALKGTQWPLSAFGPFKEKPCLPNFINDQSFEEVRYMSYEAKKQNNFPGYAQQFTQDVVEAQNRMKALLSLNRNVIETVANIYNSNQEPNTNQQVQKSNPFSVGGSGGVFGAPQSNSTNTSIFGNNTSNQANPFASSGFGTTVQNPPSIFGGNQSQPNAAGGLFGQTAFGASNNAFGSSASSVFGGSQQQPQQQPQTNTFSLPQLGGVQKNNQANSAFGLSGQLANTFGSPSIFGGQTAVAPQANLFSQQTNQLQSANLFGQPVQQQPQNLSITSQGSVQNPQNPSVFGTQLQTNIFGQAVAANQAPNVFGNTMQPTNPQQQQSIFGGQQQQQQQQAQLQHAQIQQQQVQTQQQPQSQQQTFGFGGSLPTSGFGQFQQQQPQPAQPSGNVFGSSVAPAFSTSFGTTNSTTANLPPSSDFISDSVYSKMEDLTPEALEAFKAPEFVLGKLPTVPPPRELC